LPRRRLAVGGELVRDQHTGWDRAARRTRKVRAGMNRTRRWWWYDMHRDE
jgi:hypothetical protein